LGAVIARWLVSPLAGRPGRAGEAPASTNTMGLDELLDLGLVILVVVLLLTLYLAVLP